MAELKNTVYKKLIYPGEDNTESIIRQAIKIQDHFASIEPDDPNELRSIIFITVGSTMEEVMSKIENLLETRSDAEIENLQNSYRCDLMIIPVTIDEIDIEFIMREIHSKFEGVRVCAILIDNLNRLKGVATSDTLFSASICLIDEKLKEYAKEYELPIIYNKKIPTDSMMFVI